MQEEFTHPDLAISLHSSTSCFFTLVNLNVSGGGAATHIQVDQSHFLSTLSELLLSELYLVNNHLVNYYLVNNHWGSGTCPFKQPLCVIDSNIGATMTDGRAKPLMPVSAMNGIVPIVEHGKGDIGHVIARALHSRYFMFRLDGKNPRWSRSLILAR
jgi:hypothetical protein